MIRDWLLVGAVFVVLWLFYLWLGALFDWITNYQHPIHTSPERRREVMSANKEREQSSSWQQ